MAYQKIDLVEPIYELQEKETERQHYFAELYYEISDDNLVKFIKSFRSLKKGSVWEYEGCKKTLDFSPPKPNTFRNWATCLQYKNRRRAYWDDKFKEMRKRRKEKAERFLNTFQDSLQEELESNVRISKEIERDAQVFPHLKGKGKNEIAFANKTTWDILKEVTGVEVSNVDQNINLNVDADVKQETTATVKAEKLMKLKERMDSMTYD